MDWKDFFLRWLLDNMDQFIIQSAASSYMWGFPASLWESLGFGWLVGQNKQHVDINLGSEEHFSTFYFHFTDNYSIKLENNLVISAV